MIMTDIFLFYYYFLYYFLTFLKPKTAALISRCSLKELLININLNKTLKNIIKQLNSMNNNCSDCLFDVGVVGRTQAAAVKTLFGRRVGFIKYIYSKNKDSLPIISAGKMV